MGSLSPTTCRALRAGTVSGSSPFPAADSGPVENSCTIHICRINGLIDKRAVNKWASQCLTTVWPQQIFIGLEQKRPRGWSMMPQCLCWLPSITHTQPLPHTHTCTHIPTRPHTYAYARTSILPEHWEHFVVAKWSCLSTKPLPLKMHTPRNPAVILWCNKKYIFCLLGFWHTAP